MLCLWGTDPKPGQSCSHEHRNSLSHWDAPEGPGEAEGPSETSEGTGGAAGQGMAGLWGCTCLQDLPGEGMGQIPEPGHHPKPGDG